MTTRSSSNEDNIQEVREANVYLHITLIIIAGWSSWHLGGWSTMVEIVVKPWNGISSPCLRKRILNVRVFELAEDDGDG